MAPSIQRIAASTAVLGEGTPIRRALPTAQRRLVGAWCFLDHFGPADVAGGAGLRVGPHPHIGLQTVTWLLEGEILHRDSLGSVQVIRPGQLNLMTSGRAIAHSEESPSPRPPGLHGAQLWIALPGAVRDAAPAFDHHPALPQIAHGGLRLTLLAGSALGERSPARIHTPLLGMDLAFEDGSPQRLALEPAFEHALIATRGSAQVEGEALAPGTMLYLAPGHTGLRLQADPGARLLLVGGEPFPEPVLMWWNFVARTKDEITRACHDWNRGAAPFAEVHGYDGPRLAAPLPPWAA